MSLIGFSRLEPAALGQDIHVRVSPDVKTGIEGTTEFPTIQMAMDHHPFAGIGPDGKPGRVFIEIAPGVYHERVIVTQNHTNITLVGMGKSPADVVITNSLNAKQAGGTFFTETVEINGTGFEADNITFENTAGNTGQAVAAAVRADKAVFKHCRFLGHQDTLFADYGRQYYVDSYIEGGVDFIFGNATAVFDHSEIHANGPGYLTAQSRTSPEQTTGYVIVDSKVTSGILANERSEMGAPVRDTISLGRPWRPYSRVVYINTELPADVIPEGWNAWGKSDGCARGILRGVPFDRARSECGGARAVVASTDGAAGGAIQAEDFSGGRGPLGSDRSGIEAAVAVLSMATVPEFPAGGRRSLVRSGTPNQRRFN